MTKRTCAFAALTIALLTASFASADNLRGFGRVESVQLPGQRGTQFQCDSADHALLLIHKLAHDMALSATVTPKWVTVQLGGVKAPVLVRPGLGAYLVLAKGNEAFCFTAAVTGAVDDAGALADSLSFAAPYLSGAKLYDANYAYPFYLDKWSDKGIGTWYSLYNPFNDNPKGLADIVTPHFKYLTENSLTAHVAGGLVGRREAIRYIREYKTPYHIQQWHEWSPDLARLNPFDLTVPGPQFSATGTYYGQLSYGGDKLQQYRDWDFQNTMKPYAADPQIVSWDEPHGEIGPEPFRFTYDYGEQNRKHFVQWLQGECKYTLSSLGKAWHNDPAKFKTWSDVPLPFTYELLGYDPKTCVLANTTWKIHTGDIATGISQGYLSSKFDDSQWVSMKRPNGEISTMYTDVHKRFWFRGSFTVPATYLTAHKGPLYLNDITLSEAGGPRNPDRIWFNGVDLGVLSNGGGKWVTGTKDVSGLVRPGVNLIAFSPASSSVPGTFFLAPKPLDTYPYADSGRNARYHDWFKYMGFGSMEEERHTLQAMRGIDPDRPIKIMAAADKDIFNELMSDYGAFSHNTGDEAFFRPWDRRSGYVYGLPGSAESSASMPDPMWLKRWMGYFLFEGLNSFDNFINVESMMYTPAAATWKQYFPYIHLANRYDIKQPQIAIMWSTKNDHITGVPYTFDLGRGDLQSIGYSYAYVNEISLHKGLAKPYKVLWDDGTWMMTPETVADIKKYVEEGGTFVALQETGRHTFTQADSWPIQSLTGFQVKAIRPMNGFLSILDDQPIFKKLAGQNFENYGRSVDYSGYNFADKCLALEPIAAGTQAIARYRDGSIAIGMRKLGKGRVVVLGSPFWRDSSDESGIFVPGQKQNDFLIDILTGLGLPQEIPADNQIVWKDRYTANNGSEEYLLLWNSNKTTPQTITADWNTQFTATKVFDPKTGSEYPAKIDGGKITVTATLAPYEPMILAVQSQRPPADSVADWYSKTAQWWKSSLPGKIVARPDVPLISQPFSAGEGKVVATSSLTPDRLAKLSSSMSAEGDWDSRLASIRTTYAGVATTRDQSVIYRITAKTPDSWTKRDRYFFRTNTYRAPVPRELYMNGRLVATGQQLAEGGEVGVDITDAMASPGTENIVIAVCDSGGTAMTPNILRQSTPTGVLSLAGNWTVRTDEDHATPATAQLPGKFNGLYATKSAVIPASWKGSHVFMRIADGPKAGLGRYGVNQRLIFHWSFTPRYMDITPWVKFGQSNDFLITSQVANQQWKPGDVNIKAIQLERVPTDRL
ncbi:MAG TPA: hypothetical protein VGK19_13635 [Capsulimonadaceae bacterium]|jgi:hypothetical protein